MIKKALSRIDHESSKKIETTHQPHLQPKIIMF